MVRHQSGIGNGIWRQPYLVGPTLPRGTHCCGTAVMRMERWGNKYGEGERMSLVDSILVAGAAVSQSWGSALQLLRR